MRFLLVTWLLACGGVLAAETTELSTERLEQLMTTGREAIFAEDFAIAIDSYTRVLRAGDTPYAPDALEYLGVARERNGDAAHAIEEYRRYLASYPQNDAAGRVQQRLDVLSLASGQIDADRATPPPARKAAEKAGPWQAYGGIGQYYRGDFADFGDQGSRTLQSAVLSDVDAIVRRRGERFEFETRVSLGHYYDLLSDAKGVGNDTRVYYLYADLEDAELGMSGRIGRQRMKGGGVLARFDGIRASWQPSPAWRVNVMGGEPIYSLSRSAESDRSFYGVSVDVFDLADLVDLSVYYNAQEVDGIDDREAIGGELRYYDDKRMLVSYLDYDVGYSTLNSFVALGNWTFDNELTLNASLDYRRTPYVLTENALVGQDVSSIDELQDSLTEAEIRELAEGNTGELTTAVFGFAKPVFERWKVNADVTVADFKAADTAVSSDTQYYYSLSMVGSDLIKDNDTSIITLRYLDGATTSTTSVTLDTRYPISQRLRVNPRLIWSQRDFSAANGSEMTVVAALRLFYQLKRYTRFELEIGARRSDRDFNATSFSTDAWFVYTGYRTNF